VREYFDGFESLHGANAAHHRAHDARIGAVGNSVGRGRFRVYATVARAIQMVVDGEL